MSDGQLARLGEVLAQRFALTRLELAGGRAELVASALGASFHARLVMEPSASIVVALPSTDGFELRMRWNDRWAGSGAPRAASFDDSFLIETNDLALATIWLDPRSRSALLASRYVSEPQALRHTAVMWRDAAWLHEISADEVRAERREPEPSPDRMADMLAASLELASRQVRWAHDFATIGRALGGECGARVEIGGKPMLRVRRGAVDVTVHIARRLGPADPGRLRTIVGAHRTGSGGETLSLISEGLPRAAWPPATGASRVTLTIDPRAAELLTLARPSATTVRAHDVEITFDGALGDRERLGAAIELAAWWASPLQGAGPYR